MCQDTRGLERLQTSYYGKSEGKLSSWSDFRGSLQVQRGFILEILRVHKSTAAPLEAPNLIPDAVTQRAVRKCGKWTRDVMDDVTGMLQKPERITGSFNTCSVLSKADIPQSF